MTPRYRFPCRASYRKFTRMQLTRDEITRLSPDERVKLIAQLWDSLE